MGIEYIFQQWYSTTTSSRTSISASTGNSESGFILTRPRRSLCVETSVKTRARLCSLGLSKSSALLCPLALASTLARSGTAAASLLMRSALVPSPPASAAPSVSPLTTDATAEQIKSGSASNQASGKVLPRTVAVVEEKFEAITAADKKFLAHSTSRIAWTNKRYKGRREKKAAEDAVKKADK